ncbi:MAG: polyprenyl synthetase family protein [Bacteroidales bacterium]|nr:polyprenyl synthetase family protein [Bacteroidales bacterium]
MDFIREYQAFLQPDWSEVAGLMQEALQSDIRLLNQANAHILSHNGKMLRPALSLLVGRACAGSVDGNGRKIAAAAELMHNATLLHDDVADRSAERRGVPTTSSLMGNDAAVLLGDYWLVKAMDLILSCGPHSERCIRIFSKTLSDLAEGEMLQLQKAVQGDTSRDDYFRIIYSKTASLFEAACVSAAVCAGAPDELLEAAREFGIRVGIAFQIQDDILDYTATDALGKPTGMDLKEKKITLPLLGALLAVSDERNRLVRRMVCEIDSHPEHPARIREFVLQEGGIAYAASVLEEYVAKAQEALRVFPAGEAVAMLSALTRFIGTRTV